MKKFIHWFNLSVHIEMVFNGMNVISNCNQDIEFLFFLEILYPMMKNISEACLKQTYLL